MIKKNILQVSLLVILYFFYPIFCNAQIELNYGFKLGGGPSKLKFNEIQTVIDSVVLKFNPSDESGYGAHFGVFLRAKQNNVYIQSELLYTFVLGDMVHSQYNIGTINSGISSSGIGGHYFMQINFPLIAGVQGGPFSLQAGPVISYLTYKDDYYYFKESDNKFSLAYQLGLEICIKNFFVAARYKNNLTPIIKYAYIENNQFNYKLKTSEFMFSIGFIIGKHALQRKNTK